MSQPFNLSQIQQRAENELMYAPNVAQWRRDVRQVVSDEYETLASEFPWPWLVRREPLWVFPTLTIANVDVVFTPTYERRGVILASTLAAAGLHGTEDAGLYASEFFQQQLAGAEFHLQDPTQRDNGNANWEDGPFVIEWIAPGSTVDFLLEPRFAATTSDQLGVGPFEIRFPRYRLPARCAQLLRVRRADQQPDLVPLDSQDESRLLLDRTQSGQPTHYLLDAGHELRYPPARYPDPGSDDNPHRNEEAYGFPEPIRRTFTAAAGTGGTLAAGTYRVFVAWFYAGRWGSPSTTYEVTLSGSNNRIALTGLPVMPNVLLDDYGRKLGIWVSKNDGAFYLDTMLANAITVRNIDTHPIERDQSWLLRRWEEEYTTRRQHIRLWPRPATAERLEIEYRLRVKRLADDVDVPEFDEAFHLILVHRTVMVIASRANDQALYSRAKSDYQRVLGAMLRRYGLSQTQIVQRSSSGGGDGFAFPKRAPVNWQG